MGVIIDDIEVMNNVLEKLPEEHDDIVNNTRDETNVNNN